MTVLNLFELQICGKKKTSGYSSSHASQVMQPSAIQTTTSDMLTPTQPRLGDLLDRRSIIEHTAQTASHILSNSTQMSICRTYNDGLLTSHHMSKSMPSIPPPETALDDMTSSILRIITAVSVAL